MNKRLSEVLNVDMGIAPISRAHSNIAVSGEIPLGPDQRKVMFPVTVISADLNNAQVIDIGIVDDTVVTPAATGNLATREAAGETLVYRRLGAGIAALGVVSMNVDVDGAADGVVTINGVNFPWNVAPTAGTNEWDDGTALIAAINAADLGITAAAGAGVDGVALTSTVIGGVEIRYSDTVTAVAATDILIYQFKAVMEVDASQMDIENGATGVYGVVDFTAGAGTIVVSAPAVRGASRYTPQHAISAFA